LSCRPPDSCAGFHWRQSEDPSEFAADPAGFTDKIVGRQTGEKDASFNRELFNLAQFELCDLVREQSHVKFSGSTPSRGAPAPVMFSYGLQSGAHFLHLRRLEGIDSEKVEPGDGGNSVNDDDRVVVDRNMTREVYDAGSALPGGGNRTARVMPLASILPMPSPLTA